MGLVKKQKSIYFAIDQTLVRRHHILRLSAVFLNLFALIAVISASLLTGNKPALAASYSWDGGGATNNWSDCTNWSSNICPVAADTVSFSGVANKDSVIDSGFSGQITTLSIFNYTGTISLARDLTISGTFNQTGGTFTAGSQPVTTVAFSLTGGIFNAPSSTLTASSTFSIAGGTFNHNNGRVVFAGSGNNSIACNNAVFNLVAFENVGSTKTVGSNCNLPLGSNPTTTAGSAIGIILNGTLSGSGTLTTDTLIINSTGALSGFTGLDLRGALTVSGASTNFSSYSNLFRVASTFTAATGTNFIAAAGSDFNGSFILNSGATFTAPSGTMTAAGIFTINAGATFNHGGGTVIFDGTTNTAITCNNAVFNLVTFAHVASTKTVNSGCALPLGANPTIGVGLATALILNGTLSGSGTLTTDTLVLNSTGILSGFTGLNVRAALTVSGATANFSTYTNIFAVASTFTANTGTNLVVPSGADFNGAFILNSGSVFTAPASTMTAASTFTINSGATFSHNNGTIVFDGSTATITCSNATFNRVEFQHTANTKTVASGCNLPLGNNPVIPNAVTLSGTLAGSGLLTVMTGALTMNPGGTLTGFSSLDLSALTIASATVNWSGLTSVTTRGSFLINSGSNFTGPQTLTAQALFGSSGNVNLSNTTADFNGAFILNSGSVFTASGGEMAMAGSLTINSGATFNHNNGTVDLGDLSQTITGNITFNNLTKTTSTPVTLSFGAGSTTTVNGVLTLRGTSASLLSLGSSAAGSQWNINALGTRNLRYLSVRDSNNINATVMQAYDGEDRGNNVNWEFPTTAVESTAAVTNFGFAQASLTASAIVQQQQGARAVFANTPGIRGAMVRLTNVMDKLPGGRQSVMAVLRSLVVGGVSLFFATLLIVAVATHRRKKETTQPKVLEL